MMSRRCVFAGTVSAKKQLYTTKPFDLRHLFEKVAHFIKTFDKFCQIIRLNCEEHLLLRQPLSRAYQSGHRFLREPRHQTTG